jgi:DNA polymerase
MQLWGGILAENITQAESASLLRWSLRELVDAGWGECIAGHTHDEIILEVPDAEVAAAAEALEDVMTSGPSWARGLPLAAEIEHGVVYGK